MAVIPFLRGLSTTRIFYVRDLSAYFWGRYLWLRQEWLAGHWPLWDLHVGAGQSAYVDGLNQMFLLPAVIVRLIGNEPLGFNLWILAPFPIAAIGAWLFFARRSSRAAATLGAVVFAACGPVVSSADFPNLSWSVAFLPWVLWGTDRLVDTRRIRHVGVLAVLVAGQCLAGEPVTLFTTTATALAWAAVMSGADGRLDPRRSLSNISLIGAAIGLGVALAAVQLVPTAVAATLADRGANIVPDAWSLRPTALLETVWLHLFGNYYKTQSLSDVPWMPLVFTGREPLLFSRYFGVPLLALGLAGLAGTGPRPLRMFWVGAGLVSLVGAFGSYTPVYPILRDHVPPFGTFRFPVKYIFVAVMAIAAGATLGFDHLLSADSPEADPRDRRRRIRAVIVSLGFTVAIGSFVAALAAACVWRPTPTMAVLREFATRLGGRRGTAAEFMIRTVPDGALPIIVLAACTLVLLAVAARTRGAATARACGCALAVLAAGDLVVHAWGINPVLEARLLGEPAWLARTTGDPNSRFYVGGKQGGSLAPMDFDSSRGFERVPGMSAAASRGMLSVRAAFYPSAWGGRELLSYDLPVLWPRTFDRMTKRFRRATREARDRFLNRMAVRFRILPQRRAGAHSPLMRIPQFFESFLYDFGDVAGTRASVVPAVRVVPDANAQIEALFAPGWDSRSLALVTHDSPAAGVPGTPEPPDATILADEANSTVIEAAAGAGGGWLVLLDSYSNDWHVTVDGRSADIVRADGLFRAVHLASGRHTIEFDYRPRPLWLGGTISLIALLGVGFLLTGGGRVPAPAVFGTDAAGAVRRNRTAPRC